MKSKKVLLGLFMGLLALSTSSVMAQNQGKLIEVGPNNLGGRVHSIIVDKTDATGQTIYAGASIGGLFYKDANHSEWQQVPGIIVDANNVVVDTINLPITTMVQGADGTIYIGTGEFGYAKGYNATPFVPNGRGLFKFNPTTKRFTAMTAPIADPNSSWASINKVAIAKDTLGNEVLYIATHFGLYRWELKEGGLKDWIESNKVFNDIELVEARNIGYFASGNKIFKQSNIFGNSTLQDISATNSAFTDSTVIKIELATAPSDPKYLYAMAINDKGLLEGLYVTTNQQTWSLLNTPTVTPINLYNNGILCGALEVDNGNPHRVIMAGSTIWIGNGQNDTSYYQWTQVSNSEYELNGGDYMSHVFSNQMFVHSGIHQIVQAVVNGEKVNYIATDGGVFMTEHYSSYKNMNLGLNTTQIVNMAVTPDGSIISGAYNNGCPYIQARLAHHGGNINNSWYDTATTMNHSGNVTFMGNGGQVAASKFQQVKPHVRRTIFVSSENGVARAFNDYNDYTQTQTWTIGTEFMSKPASSYGIKNVDAIPSIALFETTESKAMGDSITFGLNLYYSNNVKEKNGAIITNKDNIVDTIALGDTIKKGSSMLVLSRAHADYPFTYTFDKDVEVKEGLKITAHNPLCNRMAIVGYSNAGHSSLFVNWCPSDFSKVYVDHDATTPIGELDKMMFWPLIKSIAGMKYHLVAFSNDGNQLYATMDNTKTEESYIVRITGFNDKIDYSQHYNDIVTQMSDGAHLIYDTVAFFKRLITSISVDPLKGSDGMLVTFGGFAEGKENAIYIKNVSISQVKDSTTNHIAISTPKSARPAYSGMIALDGENKYVKAYVGTEDGLFEQTISGTKVPTFSNQWVKKGDFNGVPVTSMCQQLSALPVQHYTQHTGYNKEDYLWAKTKYPYAMYFGTYGRGIFMDMTYVTDKENEIVDSVDRVDIPQISDKGNNSVRIYPNPAVNFTNIELNIESAGKTMLRVYDISGKIVYTENLGVLAEGVYTHQINCQNLQKGMYLVNVLVGRNTATAKMLVR